MDSHGTPEAGEIRKLPAGSECRKLHRTEPEDQEDVSGNRALKVSLP